jgi:hypothetical protein
MRRRETLVPPPSPACASTAPLTTSLTTCLTTPGTSKSSAINDGAEAAASETHEIAERLRFRPLLDRAGTIQPVKPPDTSLTRIGPRHRCRRRRADNLFVKPAVAAERVSWTMLVDQRIALSADAGARGGGPAPPRQGAGHLAGHPRSRARSRRARGQGRTGVGAHRTAVNHRVEDAAGTEPGIPALGRIPGCGAIKRRRWASYLDVTANGC